MIEEPAVLIVCNDKSRFIPESGRTKRFVDIFDELLAQAHVVAVEGVRVGLGLGLGPPSLDYKGIQTTSDDCVVT